jgi:hypothetical protein
MRMIKKLKQALLCALLLSLTLLGSLATPQPMAAQATTTYFVTNVNSSQFPDVSFSLRALDINNNTLTNLNNTSFTVYENGQAVPNISVTPHADAPISIVFVIDLGRFSNYVFFGNDNLRQAISTLVTTNGLFVEGKDTVQVLGRQNNNGDQTLELRHATNASADLTNWLNAFTFPRSQANTKGLLGVTDGLKAMSVLVPVAGSQPGAIVFITRYIEDPTKTTATTAAQELGTAAHNQFVPVDVLQTDTTNDAPLRALAANSNGIYVALDRNNVPSGVTNVYQTINAQRGYYTVTYRSQGGTSGQRQITVDAATAPTRGVAGSYTVDVTPPQLQIIQPVAGSTIQRIAKLTAGGTYAYDPSSLKVTASVTWPAGVKPRALQSAQLLVNGNVVGLARPTAGATTIDFDWDLSSLTKAGSNAINLLVQATDELSVTASSQSSVTVEVVPPPTPTVAPTVAPTPAPVATGAVQQYGLYIGLAVLCLLALLVLAVVVVLLLRSRSGDSGGGGGGGGGGGRGGGNYVAPATMIVGSPVGAGQGSLAVLDGPPGVVGEVYTLSKPVTVIGRNPSRCDIVFYPNQESSMSRVHCSIRQDGKFFTLVDNNSSNGTSVNGSRIKGNDPVQLRDGDEIVMGDMAKLGVKLRFSERSASSGSDLSDRTFIVDDQPGGDQYKD